MSSLDIKNFLKILNVFNIEVETYAATFVAIIDKKLQICLNDRLSNFICM